MHTHRPIRWALPYFFWFKQIFINYNLLPLFNTTDPKIAETPEQKAKSNHGPESCCYDYCNGPKEGLCSTCAQSQFHSSGSSQHNQSSVNATVPVSVNHHHHHQVLVPSSPAPAVTVTQPAKCPYINWLAPLQCISQYPSPHTKHTTTQRTSISASDSGDSPNSSSSFSSSLRSDDSESDADTPTKNQKNDSSKQISSSSVAQVHHQATSTLAAATLFFTVILLHLHRTTVLFSNNIAWTTILRFQLAGL